MSPSRRDDDTAPPTEPAGEDFASLLEAYGGVQSRRLHLGDKVRAKVVHIGKESVFFELSASQEGSMPRAVLENEDGELDVALGDSIDAYVVRLDGGIELARRIGRDQLDVEMLQEAQHSGMPVEGTVTGVNKGGLEVRLGGGRGFCPIGQADIDYVEDPASFIGKTLQFRVQQVQENGRNIVLSRKAVLQAERDERAAKLLAELEVGARRDGTVSRLMSFGAFVDLGGIDGLVPMAELSHQRVEAAEDLLAVGQHVTVEVMRIEDDPKHPGRPRLSLSLKATEADPFDTHAAELVEGAVLPGRVVRLERFGAFVELFAGVQGLAHISEIATRRIRHPGDVLEVGQRVEARVLGVDRTERRISLSLKEAPQQSDAAGLVPGAKVEGTVTRIERYGVFLQLEDGSTALLPAAETGTPRNTDLSRAFPMGSRVAAQVMEIDERGVRVSKRAREAAEERAVVAAYGGGGKNQSLGTLGDLLKAKLGKSGS